MGDPVLTWSLVLVPVMVLMFTRPETTSIRVWPAFLLLLAVLSMPSRLGDKPTRSRRRAAAQRLAGYDASAR